MKCPISKFTTWSGSLCIVLMMLSITIRKLIDLYLPKYMKQYNKDYSLHAIDPVEGVVSDPDELSHGD